MNDVTNVFCFCEFFGWRWRFVLSPTMLMGRRIYREVQECKSVKPIIVYPLTLWILLSIAITRVVMWSHKQRHHHVQLSAWVGPLVVERFEGGLTQHRLSQQNPVIWQRCLPRLRQYRLWLLDGQYQYRNRLFGRTLLWLSNIRNSTGPLQKMSTDKGPNMEWHPHCNATTQ